MRIVLCAKDVQMVFIITVASVTHDVVFFGEVCDAVLRGSPCAGWRWVCAAELRADVA